MSFHVVVKFIFYTRRNASASGELRPPESRPPTGAPPLEDFRPPDTLTDPTPGYV